MKKRHLMVDGLVIACTGLALAAIPVMLTPRQTLGVTNPGQDEMKAKFDRVQIGMTIKEVNRVLGSTSLGYIAAKGPVTWNSWFDGSCATIHFTDGQVSDKSWTPSTRQPGTK